MGMSGNITGANKTIVSGRPYIDGTWRHITDGWANEDGNWKPFFENRAGIKWDSKSTPWDTGVDRVNSVCFGNGKFVSVEFQGTTNKKFITSENGVDWTEHRQVISANFITSICYGDDKFVLIGGTNSSYGGYSYDGINWNNFDVPLNGWISACYSDELKRFVIVSQSVDTAILATSINGITWTTTSCPSFSWYSVCAGNGMFVAVGGAAAMYSYNGIDWHSSSPSGVTGTVWTSVCYGNNMFVAVANTGTGNRVMTSNDGVNWVRGVSAANNDWRSVCYGSNMFVAGAISGTGNRIMTSKDGVNWVTRVATNGEWKSLCYGNNKFVSIAQIPIAKRVLISSITE